MADQHDPYFVVTGDLYCKSGFCNRGIKKKDKQTKKRTYYVFYLVSTPYMPRFHQELFNRVSHPSTGVFNAHSMHLLERDGVERWMLCV